jgi:hypothetical protein
MSEATDIPGGLAAMGQLRIDGGESRAREAYHYQPFPTLTSIRLLKVNGRESDGTLHVSLKTVDLADNPSYQTLSYTWGNPHANGVDFTENFNAVSTEYSVGQKVAIFCDGQVLEVQRNLLDALGELRQVFNDGQEHEANPGASSKSASPLAPNSNLYVWIDAICINQDDLEERALQVRIMDQIYHKAAHTIIWLGRADQYSQAAAETISRVASYPRDVFAQSEATPFRRQDPEIYAKSNLAYTSWMDWCSLAALLKRQWFSRLWIIQEAILSTSLVLLCGKHEIPWDELVSAARNIEARCAVLGWSPSTMFLQAHEVAVPLEHNVLRLADWREYHQNKATSQAWRFTLENLVYDTWIFTAMDPRDKIYGIFGLMDAEVRKAWDIDYHISAEEVYALATRRIIEHSQSLKILSCVQDASKRKIAAYPSWVPDYSLPYFNMMCNSGAFSAASSPQHPQHQAPTGLLLPSPSWSRLRLRAAIVDTIVETANDRTDYVNSAMLLDPSWFELALLLKPTYPATGQRRTEVLWRTLCADQDASSTVSPAPTRFGELFKELVSAMVVVRAELEEEVAGEPDPPLNCATSFTQAMQRARELWEEVGWDKLSPAEILDKTNSPPRFLWRPEHGWLVFTLIKLQALALTEEGEGGADTPSWEELDAFHEKPSYVMRVKNGVERSLVQPKDAAFTNSFRKRYGKRKLFYTEKGYLGLGPASAAVGDVVCVLPGAAGPFLFRGDEDGGVKSPDDDEAEDDGGVVKKLRLVGESYVHGIMRGEALGTKGFALKEVEIV